MSSKSVAEKLQVKGDRKLAVLNAPEAVLTLIGDAQTAAPAAADVVLKFVCNRDDITAGLADTLCAIRPDAIFWLAYLKLTSKLAKDLKCDLNRDLIRDMMPDYGLDTVSQVAIDDDWSALRLKRV